MEDTLRDKVMNAMNNFTVLILVLMEDTLRECKHEGVICSPKCLNPCFNGRYSQRVVCYDIINYKIVLILVLMEDTLRVIKIKNKMEKFSGLNPCFNGRYSQSY